MNRPSVLRAAMAAVWLTASGPAAAFDAFDINILRGSNSELDEVLNAVSVLAALHGEGEATPRDVIAAAQEDYTNFVEALYARGRYSAVVRIKIDGREAALIDPLDVPGRVGRVLVEVDPGRAFRFGRAEIGPLAPGGAPPDGFRRGEPALAPVVREAAREAVVGWREAGHAKAAIAGQDVIARHPEARLDVDIGVAPGRRVTFGDVIVASDSAVRDARIRQIAGIPRGEVYMPDAVEKAAMRLRRTGTFRSVQLTEADDIAVDGSMDIEIDVVDAPPRRIGAGVEFSSLDGLTLSGFWLHRNLFGGAERFRVEGEATQLGGGGSGPDYSLSFRFEKPAVYGPDTLFYLAAGLFYLDEPTFIEERADLSLGVSQTFSDHLTGELGVTLSYSHITSLFLPRIVGAGYPTRELFLASLPMKLTYDRRDDTLDPKEGYYLQATLEPFTAIGDPISGARLGFDGRVYRGFGDADRVVAAGRLQFGSLFGPDAVDAPPGFLYFSGGGGTVRGQPYQSLDVEYGRKSYGGRSFVGLSGELRIGVTERAGVVLFADAGYVGPESFYDGSGDFHAGAGLGVRYATPVGPIRVDVAAPVSGDTGDGVQLYIGIGQAF